MSTRRTGRFFHLVLNTDRITVEQAVGAIVAVVERPASAMTGAVVPDAEILAFRSSDRDAP